MANTRDVMGDQACLDALVANTLTDFEDDGITKVGAYGLYGKTLLENVSLPNCTSIEYSAFQGCTNLETIRIGRQCTIRSDAFSNDARLAHLVLDAPVMSTIANENISLPYKFIVEEGAVYVPSELVDTYEADGYWGNYVILPTSAYPASTFVTEISDSWAQIAAASQDGTYAQKYNVGDLKSVTIDGVDYRFVLVAKDADILASDVTKTAPMTWMMHKKLYATSGRMNETSTTEGGWAESKMRSRLNDEILPLMPSDIKNNIKTVTKYSHGYESDVAVPNHATSDLLWIPSYREVFGTLESLGPTYTSWLSSNSRRIKCKTNATTATNWWTRSAYDSREFWLSSSSGGGGGTTQANSLEGVCIGFCI